MFLSEKGKLFTAFALFDLLPRWHRSQHIANKVLLPHIPPQPDLLFFYIFIFLHISQKIIFYDFTISLAKVKAKGEKLRYNKCETKLCRWNLKPFVLDERGEAANWKSFIEYKMYEETAIVNAVKSKNEDGIIPYICQTFQPSFKKSWMNMFFGVKIVNWWVLV